MVSVMKSIWCYKVWQAPYGLLSCQFDEIPFRRVSENFMIQGGGFTVDFKQITTRLPMRTTPTAGANSND
jgi:cyclophilin family peptidyl-prolyl cis-trans isomerase